MRKLLIAGVTLLASSVALSAAMSRGEEKRLQEAADVLQELHATPDKDIPQDLWENAKCLAVIPGLKKAAFVIGGEYGKGLMSCRHAGSWSAPIFMQLAKGSWGFQIGAQSIDLVLLVMNDGGVEKLLQDKVTLGAEASVAAGPVGRDARASTDLQLKAEILSYSRTQGLFAGIDISGGVMQRDKDDNVDLYGPSVSSRDVLLGGTVRPPAATMTFMHALDRGGSTRPRANSGAR
jgi:lipid-binding SYLF domain-containing protein